MSGFEILSGYYDQFVGADYDSIADFIDQTVKKYCPVATYGVDLGCGSGTLTFRLSEMSYDMIGIDSSEAMLCRAMDKKSDDSNVLFLQQDLTELDLYGAADFMVSTLDCLNYLYDIEDVEAYLERVALFLKPNGLFVFDFNALYKYTDVLDGQNFVYKTEDAFCVWENEFDGQNMYYDLTYFVLEGDKYIRLEDHQQQTYYPLQDILDLLKKYNLNVLNITDDYTDQPLNEKTQRIVITAKKGD